MFGTAKQETGDRSLGLCVEVIYNLLKNWVPTRRKTHHMCLTKGKV